MSTYQRGELETQQWRSGYTKETKQKDTDAQTHKTTQKEQNKHNKIRQKKIKVRMNDMLCWIQHISGTGKHDREDPVAFVHWGVLLIHLRFLNPWMNLSGMSPHWWLKEFTIAFKVLWREPQTRQINSWTFSVCINEIYKSTGGVCF